MKKITLCTLSLVVVVICFAPAAAKTAKSAIAGTSIVPVIPVLQTLTITKGTFTIVVNGKKKVLRPFGKWYAGIIDGKKINFGSTRILYVLTPRDSSMGDSVAVYDAHGKSIQRLRPFGKLAHAGFNSDFIIQYPIGSRSYTPLFAIGERTNGDTVRIYHITTKGLVGIGNVNAVSKKYRGNVRVKFLPLYGFTYGLVSYTQHGRTNTVRVFNQDSRYKFTRDQTFSGKHFQVLRNTVLLKSEKLNSNENGASYTKKVFPNTPYYFTPVETSSLVWYRKTFTSLTSRFITNEQKFLALNNAISTRVDHPQVAPHIGFLREVWDNKQGWCSQVAMLFAELAQSIGYPSRVVALTHIDHPASGHVVAEVFYNGDWHLYDPDFGVVYEKPDGTVADYAYLHTNSEVITQSSFPGLEKYYQGKPASFNEKFISE